MVNGTKVGPCEIIAPLGVGGMGEAYRAFGAQIRALLRDPRP
jgi:hypothetical protein